MGWTVCTMGWTVCTWMDGVTSRNSLTAMCINGTRVCVQYIGETVLSDAVCTRLREWTVCTNLWEWTVCTIYVCTNRSGRCVLG